MIRWGREGWWGTRRNGVSLRESQTMLPSALGVSSPLQGGRGGKSLRTQRKEHPPTAKRAKGAEVGECMELEIRRGGHSSSSGHPALGGGAGPGRAAGGCCKAFLRDLPANPHSEGLIMVAD